MPASYVEDVSDLFPKELPASCVLCALRRPCVLHAIICVVFPVRRKMCSHRDGRHPGCPLFDNELYPEGVQGRRESLDRQHVVNQELDGQDQGHERGGYR